jgi:glucokinase
MEPRLIGIEIGGTKLQVVIGNAGGSIEQRWRFDVHPEKGGEGIREQLASLLRDQVAMQGVTAIGVGFGGPVDWKTGQICCSHQIHGWNDFRFGDWLREMTHRPVLVDNDANVAALGEACQGSGKGRNPVFYVTLGSGVGGGLVIDSRIYHGSRPGESEIGHVRLDKNGTIVEQSCSGWAVDAKIRLRASQAPESLLAKSVAGLTRGEARQIRPALEKNDETAWEILNETADDLAFGLSHVAHLFHPEVIVIGGGLALIGEPLRRAVADRLPRYVMDAFSPGPLVALAALGEDSVPVGALRLALLASCGQ